MGASGPRRREVSLLPGGAGVNWGSHRAIQSFNNLRFTCSRELTAPLLPEPSRNAGQICFVAKQAPVGVFQRLHRERETLAPTVRRDLPGFTSTDLVDNPGAPCPEFF